MENRRFMEGELWGGEGECRVGGRLFHRDPRAPFDG